jgi:hypothetical protein
VCLEGLKGEQAVYSTAAAVAVSTEEGPNRGRGSCYTQNAEGGWFRSRDTAITPVMEGLAPIQADSVVAVLLQLTHTEEDDVPPSAPHAKAGARKPVFHLIKEQIPTTIPARMTEQDCLRLAEAKAGKAGRYALEQSVAELDGLHLTREDICSLTHATHAVAPTAVHMYFRLIAARQGRKKVCYLNDLFQDDLLHYSGHKAFEPHWVPRVRPDLIKVDFLMLPMVPEGSQWVLVVVAVAEQSMRYYEFEPLDTTTKHATAQHRERLTGKRRKAVKATRAILAEVFKEEPMGGWHVEYPDTPKQQDRGDSGIFAMQVALAVTEYGRPEVEFGQHLMVELRRLCQLELLCGQLLRRNGVDKERKIRQFYPTEEPTEPDDGLGDKAGRMTRMLREHDAALRQAEEE